LASWLRLIASAKPSASTGTSRIDACLTKRARAPTPNHLHVSLAPGHRERLMLQAAGRPRWSARSSTHGSARRPYRRPRVRARARARGTVAVTGLGSDLELGGDHADAHGPTARLEPFSRCADRATLSVSPRPISSRRRASVRRHRRGRARAARASRRRAARAARRASRRRSARRRADPAGRVPKRPPAPAARCGAAAPPPGALADRLADVVVHAGVEAALAVLGHRVAVIAMIGRWRPRPRAGGSPRSPHSRRARASGSPSGPRRSRCERRCNSLATVGDDIRAVAALVEQPDREQLVDGLSSATSTSGAASVRAPVASRSPAATDGGGSSVGCSPASPRPAAARTRRCCPRRGRWWRRSSRPSTRPGVRRSSAKPGATVFAGRRGLGLVEGLEEARQRLRLDPDAGVADRDSHAHPAGDRAAETPTTTRRAR